MTSAARSLVRILCFAWLLAAWPLLPAGAQRPDHALGAQRPDHAPGAQQPDHAPGAQQPDHARGAQQPDYAPGVPSADGIGKRYMGREISRVMGWQGAAWLERSSREREERTDLLVDALGVTPEMRVADIGAGTGHLSRKLAAAVSPSGKVLAVDVQPEMVEMLRKSAQQGGFTNIEPSLGSETDVGLPPESVDLAVMVDVYHELSFPYEVVGSIVRSLKPGGRLVFVEYRAEDSKVPIKALHKMSEAQIRLEAQVHPVVWERTVGSLPWQHVVVFRRQG